jgi:NADH-quinone oxidoreductase subunit J
MNMQVLILGGVTLAGAVAALALRNLVHCVLCLVVSFAGLAGLYLSLSATFVGLVQVLVYLGAVAILLVFAILLTQGYDADRPRLAGQAPWVVGVGVAVLVTGGLLGAVLGQPASPVTSTADPTVRSIGERLMTGYVLPLEAMALLLTAALIGAVVLAMPPGERADQHPGAGASARTAGETADGAGREAAE